MTSFLLRNRKPAYKTWWLILRGPSLCAASLNSQKSNTLRIAINGKRKQWLCDPVPFIGVSGTILPAIYITCAYKCLGISISARERDSKPEELLTRGLNQLTRAPLKPQQRLFILVNNLLPKLYHRLVLPRIHGGVIRRMDKSIRRHVKSWLKLPDDCVNAYIYTDVKEGGLGVPSLRVTIPCLKYKRMERLSTSADEFVSAMVRNSSTFQHSTLDTNSNNLSISSTRGKVHPHGSLDLSGLCLERVHSNVYVY